MSEKECRSADWAARGERDGMNGERSDYIDSHIKACGKVGVVPNEPRWLQAWQIGIQRFCTAERAWSEGVANRSYSGACEGQDKERDFVYFYEAGRQVAQTQSRLSSNARDMERLEKELKNAKTDDDRKRLRRQLRDLDFEQERLRDALRQQHRMRP